MTGRAILAVALAAALPAGAMADMLDTTGMKPWEACALCHGLDGNSRMARFPRLAGQPIAYLVKQLEDFRAGRRHNDDGVMVDNAGLLEPGDIPAVATHFSVQPAPQPMASDGSGKAASGAEIFMRGKAAAGTPACAGCHLDRRAGEVVYPHITAQHSDYIAKQLKDFRAGLRTNDPAGVMRRVAATLDDSEIEAVARYAASRSRQ